MYRKSKSPYFIPKIKNLHIISVNSSFLNKKSQRRQKSIDKKQDSYNRSTSFQTVKKIHLSKIKKNRLAETRTHSQRSNLNSTIKKKVVKRGKTQQKSIQKTFIDYRSDFKPKSGSLSTPKFGEKIINAQNLTDSRLSLIFQLQSIKKEFSQNLNQMSLTFFKRLNPLQQSLRNCLKKNQELLEREWYTIRKSCINVKSQKENQAVQKMIWNWQKKRLKIKEIQSNLQKALQVLLL